jgi:hypothetical protein
MQTPPSTSFNSSRTLSLTFESVIDTSQLKSPGSYQDELSPLKSIHEIDYSLPYKTIEHTRSMSISSLILPPFSNELEDLSLSRLSESEESEKMEEKVETADALLSLAYSTPTKEHNSIENQLPTTQGSTIDPKQIGLKNHLPKSDHLHQPSKVVTVSSKIQLIDSESNNTNAKTKKEEVQHIEKKDLATSRCKRSSSKKSSHPKEPLKNPKERRRERNRLAARRSRERKILLVENLQQENQELKDELFVLKKKYDILLKQLECKE